MAHTINLLKPGIVEIVHTGRMRLEDASKSRNEAAALMVEKDLRSVLADVSGTDHEESTADLLEFNASHYDVFPPRTRLAVVIPSDPSKADSAHFAETVAVNRGIMMKVFLKKDDAMNWLQGKDEAGGVA